MKDQFIARWNLTDARHLISTPRSELWRVRTAQGIQAVLKIGASGSESLGIWNGRGAVILLEAASVAADATTVQLLEYIDGPMLRTWVERGDDVGATRVIANVAKRLHVPGEGSSMEAHFKSLRARRDDPRFREHARVAEELISSERETCVLHGDLHHENILFSSARGWLAIDPRSLRGEREYDFANMFYNPVGYTEMAARPETIHRRRAVLRRELDLDPVKLWRYVFAHGGLSAVWSLEDGRPWSQTLEMSHQLFVQLRPRPGDDRNI